MVISRADDALGLFLHILHQKADVGDPLRFLVHRRKEGFSFGRLQLDHQSVRPAQPAIIGPHVEIFRLRNKRKVKDLHIETF